MNDDLTAQAASALFRITRRFGRPLKGLLADEQGKGVELSRIMVAQAIHQLDQQEATIGKVAEELNVDPSTASRLIADTIRDGYALRQPSQRDGRRAVLQLTSQGVNLVQDATAFQLQVMRDAMQGWTEQEKQEFSRLFLRFSEALSKASEEQT